MLKLKYLYIHIYKPLFSLEEYSHHLPLCKIQRKYMKWKLTKQLAKLVCTYRYV